MSIFRYASTRARASGPVMCAGAAALVLAGSACAAEGSFPDDWFFSGAQRPQPLRSLEGQPAPELVTQAWIGDPVTLKDARGKVVVLDFWATWCGPCMAAIPENIALVDRYRDKGLVFIGVHDANSGWDKAAGVVQSKGINYPVAHDKGDSAKNVALQFWPTYVVIDRMGVIRGAGLLPGKVKEAVELLLAEAGPADGVAPGGPPAEWFFGGDSRPSWLRRMEGKPGPAIDQTTGGAADGAHWHGAPMLEADRRGKILVVQFLSPGSELALRHVEALAELDKELGAQGVAFMGICDARVPWEKASQIFSTRQVAIPIVQDAKGVAKAPAAPGASPAPAGAAAAPGVAQPVLPAGTRVVVPAASGATSGAVVVSGVPATPATVAAPVGAARVGAAASTADAVLAAALQEMGATPGVMPAGAAPGASAARALMSMGATADAMGLRIAPITVVIDRSGVVRAAGVRPDRLRDVLTVLLAEPTPSAPPVAPANPPALPN